MVDGSLVSDPIIVLNEWTKHFAERGKSQLSTQQNHPPQYSLSLHELEASSYQENDNILDTPFIVEEIDAAIRHRRTARVGMTNCLLIIFCTVVPWSQIGSVRCLIQY